MRETRIKSFGHVQRKYIDSTIRKNDSLEVIGTQEGRKTKEIIDKIVYDLWTTNLTDEITLDWTDWKRKNSCKRTKLIGKKA